MVRLWHARQTDCRPGAFGQQCPHPATMVRRLLTIGAVLATLGSTAWAAPRPGARTPLTAIAKLDRELRERASAPKGRSRVILRLNPGVSADAAVRGLRGTVGRRLSLGGQVADVPDTALDALARLP